MFSHVLEQGGLPEGYLRVRENLREVPENTKHELINLILLSAERSDYLVKSS